MYRARTTIRMIVARMTRLLERLRTERVQIGELVTALLITALSSMKFAYSGITTEGIECTASSLELIDVAISHVDLDSQGLWLEFGVFKGHSINHIASRTASIVYGFDSFIGLPVGWGPRTPAGTFSLDGGLPKVRANVALLKGVFEEVLPSFLNRNPMARVSFMHIDCDLYDAGSTVLHALSSRLQDGSVIVIDDFFGALPDDLFRAFREWASALRISYEWIGYSYEGAIALRILRQ